MHTHISDCNDKMGPVPNLSMTPCISCNHDAPCRKAGQCYAMKFMRRPNVKTAWTENYEMAMQERNQYQFDINCYLTKKHPRFFRWHVAGDILDQDYLNMMIKIAKNHPATNFLAFTKMHNLDYSKTPKNLEIVFSLWPGWGKKTKGHRYAYMQDGTETRIPKNAIECPGLCENCMICWKLSDLKRDVWFSKH